MAVPYLHVSTVLTNIVCDKVPIPAQPRCFKDNLNPFSYSYHCCPYNFIFLGHNRICACVPPDYAKRFQRSMKIRNSRLKMRGYKKAKKRKTRIYNSSRPRNRHYRKPKIYRSESVSNSIQAKPIARSPLKSIQAKPIARRPPDGEKKPKQKPKKQENNNLHRFPTIPSKLPIYYLNYRLRNGVIVRMPVIYEYHQFLPRGVVRFIRLQNRGFLIPISIYVYTSGRFVYNPVILGRFPSLLSKLLLAKRQGTDIRPLAVNARYNKQQQTQRNQYIHHTDLKKGSGHQVASFTSDGGNNDRPKVSFLSKHQKINKEERHSIEKVPTTKLSDMRAMPNTKWTLTNGLVDKSNSINLQRTRVFSLSNRGPLNNIPDVKGPLDIGEINSRFPHGNALQNTMKGTISLNALKLLPLDSKISHNGLNMALHDQELPNSVPIPYYGAVFKTPLLKRGIPKYNNTQGVKIRSQNSKHKRTNLTGISVQKVSKPVSRKNPNFFAEIEEMLNSGKIRPVPFRRESSSFVLNSFFRHFQGNNNEGNGIIGIATKGGGFNQIPSFPGALNGGFGSPLHMGGIPDANTFRGVRVGQYIDPTTGLPSGFTVLQPDDRGFGSVLASVDSNRLQAAAFGQKERIVVAQNPSSITQEIVNMLTNTAVITEIRNTLLQEPNPSNPNVLTIPPEILDTKNRNLLIDYLNWLLISESNSPTSENIPKILVKFLQNPVFVDYIQSRLPLNDMNTIDVNSLRSRGLIFDRINIEKAPGKVGNPRNLIFDKIDVEKNPEQFRNQRGLIFDRSSLEIKPGEVGNQLAVDKKSREFVQISTTEKRNEAVDPIDPPVKQSKARLKEEDEDNGSITIPIVPSLTLNNIKRHVEVLSKPLSKELCLGCKIDGGMGYTNHPDRCDMFVVCYPGEGGDLVPIAQDCPYGLFWSQSALTCMLSKDVHCPHEICKGKYKKYQYAHKENCQGYWECQNGYSLPHCCPRGKRFVDGQGCVKDDGTCDQTCPPGQDINEQSLWQGSIELPAQFWGQCDKREIPGKPTKYERQIPRQDWIIQECPPGTIFRREVCDCSMAQLENPNYAHEGQHCSPEVYLPFTNDFLDASPGGTHVRVENVTRMSGAACFNGDGALAMPRFANMDIGNYLNVHIKYKQSSDSPETEALLYNGDCFKQPSMVLGTTAKGIYFAVMSTSGERHTMWVPNELQVSDWKTVSLVIDDGHIEITTDTDTSKATMVGGVARSQCGMKIGWGEGYKHFNGCIDEFSLYRCRPDPSSKDHKLPLYG